MEFTQNDFDRLLQFEAVRKTSEAKYVKNPLDADNLTNWGGALLELSQFHNPEDSKKMIEEAITKLEEALTLDPSKHNALWTLGNCYTSVAFLIPAHDEAKAYFDNASACFHKAAEEDPGNELYKKSLEITTKAPELHMEIHKHAAFTQQTMGGMGVGPSASNPKSSKNKKNSDLTYDILGWIILAVGIVAWVGMAKSHVPPPPPR